MDALMAGQSHEVVEGECTASIAADAGVSWSKIWDASENEGLREAGREPNLLAPGDALHIPEREAKDASVATSRKHRVVLAGQTVTVHLTLVGSHEPLADEPWVVEYAGKTKEGTTDGEGKLELTLPARLGSATLELPNRKSKYTLALGSLGPANTLAGAHERLHNLGFTGPRPADAADEAPTREALRQFQEAEGLEPTGELDDDTVRALQDAHGC